MTKITIKDDFSLEKIQKSGQCFRVANSTDGLYRFICESEVLYIKETGTHEFEISCTKTQWNNIWKNYFDLKRNYAQIRKSAKADNEFIKSATQFGKGLRVLKQNSWEMLITFIISQRKSIPAIATSIERLCEKFGDDITTSIPTKLRNIEMYDLADRPAPTKIFSFPTPSQLASATESELRECGLGYRAAYILNTARMVASGELDLAELEKYDDATLFEMLKTAPGVGDKVANCVCLFGFNRVARVPIDVWIERVIKDECGGQNIFLDYEDYAGIMQQFAFYYKTQTSK